MTVVLLHAFPLDSRIWREVKNAIAPKHDVIAPDLRGFGQNAQADEIPERSVELNADDIARLIDERAAGKAVVAGISRGGYIALALARRHPEKLAGLILLDTRATPSDDKEKQIYTDLIRRVEAEGSEAAVEIMRTRLLGPSALKDNPALVTEVEENIRSQKPASIAAAARGMIARPDAQAGLSALRIPVLAIAGEDDAAFDSTKAIASAVPHAQFVAIPNSGHLTILENPEAVVAAVESFLLKLGE